MNLLRIKFSDESGNISCVWFNQDYLFNRFKPGEKFMIFGRIDLETWRKYGRKEIKNPIFESADKEELIHTDRIVPIYSSTENLSLKVLRKIVYKAMNCYQAQFKE